MAQSQEQLEALIQKIKEVNDKPEDASDSENSIGDLQTNRFNKLKRKSRYVSRGKLGVAAGTQADSKTVFYGAKRRTVIQTRDDGDSDSEDAYHGINIEELLAPIDDPAEVLTHPAHRYTFKRKALPILASHALQTIATEHEHRVHLSRLLTAFLGDDPTLIMQKYKPTETSLQTHTITDEFTNKTMTRHSVALEEDHLLAGEFVTPVYDRNLGINPEEAEEARRLLQAALDRSEEYLRCMQRVRAGLVRADRCRKRTWKWCKDSRDSE